VVVLVISQGLELANESIFVAGIFWAGTGVALMIDQIPGFAVTGWVHRMIDHLACL
jgi:hypothetical protein